MGSLQASEFAEAARAGALSQDAALTWHLQSNHFPPVSLDFLPAVKDAIVRANQELWDEEIELPNGRVLTVAAIVEGLHLDSFIEEDALYDDV